MQAIRKFTIQLLMELPKDVTSIVYRYLHKSLYNEVLQQYKTIFQPGWDDEMMMFISSDKYYTQVMWRDLEDCNTMFYETYTYIYNMYKGTMTTQLPKHYYKAGRRF